MFRKTDFLVRSCQFASQRRNTVSDPEGYDLEDAQDLVVALVVADDPFDADAVESGGQKGVEEAFPP